MNAGESCLYDCVTTHARFKPKSYRLSHSMFMFYLNLDTIDEVFSHSYLLRRNRPGLFSFYDKDHLEGSSATAKDSILAFIRSKGVEFKSGRMMLLTHLRMFGYVFNPVSFYFCFDESDKLQCLVAEVGNTFGEQKPFLLRPDTLRQNCFIDRQKKYYYISPFVPLDCDLDFKVTLPEEKLDIRVDDYQGQEKIFVSALMGSRTALKDSALMVRIFRYPLMTFFIPFYIHWHAFKLWLMKIPFLNKEDNPDLQREVTRVCKKR